MGGGIRGQANPGRRRSQAEGRLFSLQLFGSTSYKGVDVTVVEEESDYQLQQTIQASVSEETPTKSPNTIFVVGNILTQPALVPSSDNNLGSLNRRPRASWL